MKQRLTGQMRLEIYYLAHSGAPQKEIAKQFGITVSYVSQIKIGPMPETDDVLSQRGERCPGCGKMIFHWPCLECAITGMRIKR